MAPGPRRRKWTEEWRKTRLIVFAHYGEICRIKGPGCTTIATEVDHIVPLSAGGAEYDLANLRPACRHCNSSRPDVIAITAPPGSLFAKAAKPKRNARDDDALAALDHPNRRVVLLTGPPGAGKTTIAHQSGLTVYDRDDDHWRDDEHFRRALAALRTDHKARVVVIRSGATSSARDKTRHQVRATHVYRLTASKAELERRVLARNQSGTSIKQQLASIPWWFKQHDNDDNTPPFTGWDDVDLGAKEFAA